MNEIRAIIRHIKKELEVLEKILADQEEHKCNCKGDCNCHSKEQ